MELGLLTSLSKSLPSIMETAHHQHPNVRSKYNGACTHSRQ